MSNTLPANKFVLKIKQWLKNHAFWFNQYFLKKDIRCLGNNLKVKGILKIRFPELCIFGSNISIGKSVVINNFGGVIISDGCKIGNQVTLGVENTTLDSLPIVIGQNCILENGVAIKPGTIIKDGMIVTKNGVVPNKNSHKTILNTGEHRFFIVCTGASGSTSMANILSQHPRITCWHEPNTILVSLSTAYAYGKVDRQFVKDTLSAIYCKSTFPQEGIIGESDQKLANMIPIISELLPASKFIWLIRNPYDFVQSTNYNKNWYTDKKIESPNLFPIQKLWLAHRLNGYLCKAIPAKKWREMNSIEKNSWFWVYWNSLIEENFSGLPKDKWTFVQLEKLSQHINEIQAFLGVNPKQLEMRHDNVGKKLTKLNIINEKDQAIVQQICGDKMEVWFS